LRAQDSLKRYAAGAILADAAATPRVRRQLTSCRAGRIVSGRGASPRQENTMDQALGSGDDGSRMPLVKVIDAVAPFRWLRKGWRDLWQAPVGSLAYGVVFAAIGAFLVSFAWGRSHLAPALVSGFLLVAPFLAINLYALSRQIELTGRANPIEALRAWRANAGSIALFGLLLVFALIGWERISAIVFALFYGGSVPDLNDFLGDVLFSGRYQELLIAYFGIGAIVAAVVFAVSVVSPSILLDRDVDAATAVITSVSAVRKNPGPMLLWAALLALLTAIGIATWMIGLVLIFPWLGHASWHAYREIVE